MHSRTGWLFLSAGLVLLAFVVHRYRPFLTQIGAIFGGDPREGFVLLLATGLALVLLGLDRLLAAGGRDDPAGTGSRRASS